MEHGFLWLEVLQRPFGLHIPVNVGYFWLAMLILIVVSLIFARKPSFVPGGGQNVLEVAISTLEDFIIENLGEHGRPYVPFLATLFLVILTMNLLGLIPGCTSATANLNTNAAMAICAVVYAELVGFKTHGAKYIKHFTGPIIAIAPIMIPIEIISRLARILSLTFRLFGNIMSKEILLMLLFINLDVGKYLLPTLPIYVLGIFVCLVQALIFFMLSMIYFNIALEEAH